jgi:predicted ATPase
LRATFQTAQSKCSPTWYCYTTLNHIHYPQLLHELAEEFRDYARRGGQVFVSTHSPDFLNGCELEEVFWLKKEQGYTVVKRASEDEQIKAYMNEGDKLGYLWRQGFFDGADPL